MCHRLCAQDARARGTVVLDETTTTTGTGRQASEAGCSTTAISRVALGVIILSTVLRLAYTYFALDYSAMQAPEWGPDSPAYTSASAELYDNGLLADTKAIPLWPAGYPIFLASVYGLAGLHVDRVFLVQQLLLSLALLITFRLVSRELSPKVGLLTVILLAASPGFGLSASAFMYEPLLALAAVSCVELLSVGMQEPPGRRRAMLGTAAFFVAGLGAALQPKLLAAAGVLAVWMVWRTRRVLIPVLCSAALLIGPVALIARNSAAGEGAVLSANLGFTLLLGANDYATGGYVDANLVAATCGGLIATWDAELDPVWRDCALNWIARHPVKTALLTVPKAAYFWLPMGGALGGWGTWRHAADPHRWVPERTLTIPAVRILDYGLGALWAISTVALLVLGCLRLRREPERRPALVLLASPIAVFMLISMATLGDARFRLPVSPFTTALIAYGVLPSIDRAMIGIRSRRPLARISV